MPDSRFYRRAGPYSLAEIASISGCEIGSAPADLSIVDVGTLSGAGPGDISFFHDAGLSEECASSKCGACITTSELADSVSGRRAVLTCSEPRLAFAKVAAAFYPALDSAFFSQQGEAISPKAHIGKSVHLGLGAVVGARAEIGDGTRIGANAVIGPGVVLGEACVIGENVTITHAIFGNRVYVSAGTQIGQDGFGFVPSKTGLIKIPQLGRVIIGDDVDVGANCTIDRGALDDTVVGQGTKIDNLVQIGHNVTIGRNCILVSQVGISGSCRIGDGVVIGGQGGLADHITVGDGAQIAAKSGIMRDVPPGETVMGYPAKPIRQFWREIAALARLTKRGK